MTRRLLAVLQIGRFTITLVEQDGPLGDHLRRPPAAPALMDDDKTPTVQIEPIKVAPPHKE